VEPVILIALVNETLRETYGLLFAEQGYRVLTASTVLECLHKVRWTAPEVLLLDEDLWGGGEGVLAISGEDILWPSVVLLTSRRANLRDDLQSPPVVASLGRPVDFASLLESVTAARRIFLYTGGRAAWDQ
jgi:DNA-binding response OmpR family regulator